MRRQRRAAAPGPRFKDAAGRLKTLSPAAFRRLFRAAFCPTLRAPASLPCGYLVGARKLDRRTSRDLGARRVAALRRRVRAGRAAAVYIAKAGDAIGHGLYAERALRAGELIGEYSGVLTRDWAADVEKPADFNPYLLRYPFECALAIDARKKGGVARFINHSAKKANVGRVYVLQGGLLRVVFVANRRIPKDAQLLLDYGKRYWRGRRPKEIRA